MTAVRPLRPRLSLPFTVIADGEAVHLIGGEDVRYTIRAGSLAPPFAAILRRCDGRNLFDALLVELPEDDRVVARDLLDRLWGERILLDGSVEEAHVAGKYQFAVEGRGPLVERLVAGTRNCEAEEGLHRTAGSATADSSRPTSEPGKPLAILCQDTLDLHAALEFNRRVLRSGAGPWMWVTTGPADRGYVSPVFLPNAGPCLACLLHHFQRLSPVPQLYDALIRHGEQQGPFAPASFPSGGLAILEQLVLWKLEQLNRSPAPLALFRLHVVQLETMEVSVHRVFVDPSCPECANARLV